MPQQSTVIVVIYHGVRRDVEDFSTPRGLRRYALCQNRLMS